MSDVRVRFAPSPTGELHIGSVRTTLYNFLFARQNRGALILRIEDTDQERLVPGAIDSIYDGLHWLGIRWDEGPREGGPFAPYVQSERLSLYRERANELVATDRAYPCFCSRERLDAMRREQEKRHEVTRYDRLCRRIAPADAKRRVGGGEAHTIRLKVPEDGVIVAHDLIHGDVSWQLKDIDDQIIMKSDGFPTYHLAVVVDDHVMRITHVLRGDEWFPSLPKHLLLYRFLGWDAPLHGHLPLVLGPDHKKLSKRHGATAVREFRDQGYLPEALVNYLALLGWASGTEEEVFTMEQLVERWSIEHLQDSPAVWDKARLDWFNGVHIRMLDDADLAERLGEFLPAGASPDAIRAAVPLIKERIKTFVDAREMLAFLFTDDLEYPIELLVGKRQPAEVRRVLERASEIVSTGPFTPERIETELRRFAAESGAKVNDVFMPVRVAVTGRTVSPPLDGSILLLGRDRALRRLRHAIARLSEPVAA